MDESCNGGAAEVVVEVVARRGTRVAVQAARKRPASWTVPASDDSASPPDASSARTASRAGPGLDSVPQWLEDVSVPSDRAEQDEEESPVDSF